MKKFLAIYIGTTEALAQWQKLDEQERKKQMQEGMAVWMKWHKDNAASILDAGNPLGFTKSISNSGIADTKNQMTGYVLVQAETQQAAAQLFVNHPHFTIFPGASVEIMECLPMPGM
ncbi:MAG TPA: hypothetical protein VHO25_14145 [Polyangiaceae bacterium]|jgi:hypothetical protein|nr:hypothetical protein [Polyangiaceae bacterium]